MGQPASDAVVNAATAALELSGDAGDTIQTLQDHLGFFEAMVLERLSAGDKLRLFVPVALEIDGKARVGAISVFDDKFWLTYTEGVIRMSKRNLVEYKIADVRTVERGKAKVGRSGPDCESALVTMANAAFRMTFHSPPALPSIAATVCGLLTGSTTVEWTE